MKNYTHEQQSVIDCLAATINADPCPMAVVDYLGMRDGDGVVTKRSHLSRRFGCRDMRHVAIYKLKVVELNQAAQAQREGADG